MGGFNCLPCVPLVTCQFLNLIFSPFGSCLTVPSPDKPSKLQRSETHPLGVVFKHLTSLWKCRINPTHRHPSLFDGKPVKYLDEVAVICSWKQLGSAQSSLCRKSQVLEGLAVRPTVVVVGSLGWVARVAVL